MGAPTLPLSGLDQAARRRTVSLATTGDDRGMVRVALLEPQKSRSMDAFTNQYLSSGKRFHHYEKKAFYSSVNQLFRLGHGFNCKMLIYQRGLEMVCHFPELLSIYVSIDRTTS